MYHTKNHIVRLPPLNQLFYQHHKLYPLPDTLKKVIHLVLDNNHNMYQLHRQLIPDILHKVNMLKQHVLVVQHMYQFINPRLVLHMHLTNTLVKRTVLVPVMVMLVVSEIIHRVVSLPVVI